jgi:phage shock protein A
MAEQEITAIEQVVEQLERTQLLLRQEIAELEERIGELERAKTVLVRLLPPEQRLDHLFH